MRLISDIFLNFADFAPPPISTLLHIRNQHPELIDNSKFDIYIDGGVRRGTDVLKALCLGAKGVGLGRSFIYANVSKIFYIDQST